MWLTYSGKELLYTIKCCQNMISTKYKVVDKAKIPWNENHNFVNIQSNEEMKNPSQTVCQEDWSGHILQLREHPVVCDVGY